VDPLAVARAAAQAVWHGEVVSGASTLTMQAARLLEPRPRTLPSKLIEMARALQLTAHLGRDGVLDAYLTLAPFGGNIEGVRAAALAWWGKEPRRLTPGQAALLVALPQNPTSWRPDRHPEAARAARAKVLRRMVGAGVLTALQAREAEAEPLPEVRQPMPLLAAHVARRLAEEQDPTDPPVIPTTLDAALQARVEALVRAHADSLGARVSVAALVVEAGTGEARAWVGSPGLLDTARRGAIDMTRAPRSPGSALKPLIYGMAFEDGLLHPLTEIDDRPMAFGGGYAPENFGFAHHGRVTAAEALRRSLNVPAVAVLDRVGPMRFAARLTEAGVTPRRRGGLGRPGLPLALGGLGVTLEELVGLYATIAVGGERRVVRVQPIPNPSQNARSVGLDADRDTPLLPPEGGGWEGRDAAGGTVAASASTPQAFFSTPPQPSPIQGRESGRLSPSLPGVPVSDPPTRILSETAAWQLRSILAEAPPAAGFAPDDATRGGRTVAFKTGTSYGFRDAWAIGMDGDHVVGVWVGRADGTPVPGIIGRETAAPLMRALFDLLAPPRRPLPGPRPAGVLDVARGADLPPPLRRLTAPDAGRRLAATGTADPLRLRFPPDGATLDWDQAALGLVLEADGGRRPYAWLVNGRPLETAPWHRGAQWRPDGRGLARVTVVDAAGRSAGAQIWLK
jgi:penicillin-binding protein 1C